LLREWLAEKGGEEDPEFIQEALVQAAKNGARETVELFITLGIVRPTPPASASLAATRTALT
jgi:hypothetical protein